MHQTCNQMDHTVSCAGAEWDWEAGVTAVLCWVADWWYAGSGGGCDCVARTGIIREMLRQRSTLTVWDEPRVDADSALVRWSTSAADVELAQVTSTDELCTLSTGLSDCDAGPVRSCNTHSPFTIHSLRQTRLFRASIAKDLHIEYADLLQ